MSNGISPILVIVLVIIGIANLIPFLIYLDYKRRLYRQLQQRRNSDEHHAHPDNMFDEEEEEGEEIAPKIMAGLDDDEDKNKVLQVLHENDGSAEEKARSFVAKQEQILQAARSRWGNRSKGYGVLSSVPANA